MSADKPPIKISHIKIREDWLARCKEEVIDPALPIIDPHHHLWHRDGHQARNAQAAARSGAAVVVEQDDLDVACVRGLLQRYLVQPSERQRMADLAAAMGRPAAARSMAAHLIETLGDALAEPQVTVELGG